MNQISNCQRPPSTSAVGQTASSSKAVQSRLATSASKHTRWNFWSRINRWGGSDTQKLKSTQRTCLRFPDGRTCATLHASCWFSERGLQSTQAGHRCKAHRCKGSLGVRSLNTPKGEVNSTHITSLRLFLYL